MVKLIILTYKRILAYIKKSVRGQSYHPDLPRLRQELKIFEFGMSDPQRIRDLIVWEYTRDKKKPLSLEEKKFLGTAYAYDAIAPETMIALLDRQTLWDTDRREL